MPSQCVAGGLDGGPIQNDDIFRRNQRKTDSLEGDLLAAAGSRGADFNQDRFPTGGDLIGSVGAAGEEAETEEGEGKKF